jgi:hypothetical protein
MKSKLFKLLMFCCVILSINLDVFSQTKRRLPCIDKKFTVVAHIVLDSLGNPNIGAQGIYSNFNALNDYFEPICVSFEVCEIKYITNSTYNVHSEIAHWQDLQTLYHQKNRINVFYIEEFIDPVGVDGYAGLAGITRLDSSGMVLKKTSGVRTLAHEMGHYFGLKHTFEGSGAELVNGNNCNTIGDGICDTPADPFIFGSNVTNYVNSSCQFISTVKDANGEYYNPIVGNVMSYYPDYCDCGFTHQQYLRMAATYLGQTGMW